jgi:hypothetical protein
MTTYTQLALPWTRTYETKRGVFVLLRERKQPRVRGGRQMQANSLARAFAKRMYDR